MKTFIILLNFILITSLSTSFSQDTIPNASFEDWDVTLDLNGDTLFIWDPTNWDSEDFLTFDAVYPTSDSYSGSSAAKLEVIDDGTGASFYPRLFAEFPISRGPSVVIASYKLTLLGQGYLRLTFSIYDSLGNIIGYGQEFKFNPESTFRLISVQVLPYSEIPASVYIEFYVSGDIGTYAIVDDLNFNYPVDVQPNVELPSEYALKQNYPNPFNPTTTITYELPKEGFVTLKIFDVLGNEVTTLVNEQKPAGSYNVDFDASNLASGIYLYKIDVNDFSETRKLSLLK